MPKRAAMWNQDESGRVHTPFEPVVLGLGGWLLGVIVVSTTMPGVALDDELLALLSIGVPIGLGVYLGWVRGDGKGVGLAAALAGALAGAWLGFHATTDLAALLTAIAGAIAFANLALILLDVSRARPVRARAETTGASVSTHPAA